MLRSALIGGWVEGRGSEQGSFRYFAPITVYAWFVKGCFGNSSLAIRYSGIRNSQQWFACVTAKQYLASAQFPNPQGNLYWIRYIQYEHGQTKTDWPTTIHSAPSCQPVSCITWPQSILTKLSKKSNLEILFAGWFKNSLISCSLSCHIQKVKK